ncbi:MAG: hypothetical protein ACRERD_10375 [Candidatus Binatia bacterium]
MADEKTTQPMDDVVTVTKTLLFDLPLARVRQRLGLGEDKEPVATAWKGYDAGVRLAATAVDTLYRSPVVGDVVARSLDVMLRWQQVSNAVSGAFFAGLWQAVGLPTAAETQALRSELQALREELRGQTNNLVVKPKVSESRVEREEPRDHTQSLIHSNGAVKPLRVAA